MKRFVLALAFACALSSTAMAGHIPTSGVAAPEPPPSPLVTIVQIIISAVV